GQAVLHWNESGVFGTHWLVRARARQTFRALLHLHRTPSAPSRPCSAAEPKPNVSSSPAVGRACRSSGNPQASRATDRWALPLLTLRVRHTCDHESPSRRSANTRSASTWARGLPNFLPLARAFRRPALTRSWISERSNSAIAPMICSMRRPDGVLKSRLSRRLTKATPYAARSAGGLTISPTDQSSRRARRRISDGERRPLTG